MNRNTNPHAIAIALGCALGLFGGCKSVDVFSAAPPVTIASYGANAVSVWNEIATTTINVAAATDGTAAERQPVYSVDLATLNVAIYDAVTAIAGTHKPYAITPKTVGAGASMEAAVSSAAYGVLKGLFPARSGVYQGTYDSLTAAIAETEAKTRGIALGAEVAQGILALRVNDGRATPLTAYVAGTAPGKFRGSNPINRFVPNIKPFAMASASQFRAEGPPALGSPAYAAEFSETKSFGSANSTIRTTAQTEVALFHTEPPFSAWPRNLRQFATSHQNLADNARLMALIWVAHADATIACFESKYHFDFWRPISAIAFADTDAAADSRWTPAVPTPNHPEYPAAHSCVAGATAEALHSFFGTDRISFKFDSTVPGTVVHRFTSTDGLVNEIQAARIHGGMHFRTATDHGAALGAKVTKWVVAQHFQRRD